jgi:tetratricopeptide (TPR) repeat protein
VLGLIANDRYDWEGAEEQFRQAIVLDPGYPTAHQWYGGTLMNTGRLEEALAECKRAQELDPLSLIINTNVGEVFYLMRQYDRAQEQYNNTLALDQTFPWAHFGLGSVYEVQGRLDEAVAEFEKMNRLAGGTPLFLAYLGRAYIKAGRKEDGRRILDSLLQLTQQGYALSTGIGLLYFRLGDRQKTFEWLEKAYQARETELLYLLVDPLCDDVRSDPRCVALLKKMGLRQ